MGNPAAVTARQTLAKATALGATAPSRAPAIRAPLALRARPGEVGRAAPVAPGPHSAMGAPRPAYTKSRPHVPAASSVAARGPSSSPPPPPRQLLPLLLFFFFFFFLFLILMWRMRRARLRNGGRHAGRITSGGLPGSEREKREQSAWAEAPRAAGTWGRKTRPAQAPLRAPKRTRVPAPTAAHHVPSGPARSSPMSATSLQAPGSQPGALSPQAPRSPLSALSPQAPPSPTCAASP